MDNQPLGCRRYVSDFMGPAKAAEITRSLPSLFWVKDVSAEAGADVGGGGAGGAGAPGCLRAAGGSLGVIATTRGPLMSEKGLPCRATETSMPVVLLICNDKLPTAAVSRSADSAAAGFALAVN